MLCNSCAGRHSSSVPIPQTAKFISSQMQALQQPPHLPFTIQTRNLFLQYTWTQLLLQLQPLRGRLKILDIHFHLPTYRARLVQLKYWFHPDLVEYCFNPISSTASAWDQQNDQDEQATHQAMPWDNIGWRRGGGRRWPFSQEAPFGWSVSLAEATDERGGRSR